MNNAQDNEMIPLSLDDTFHFSCSPQVPCYNSCCRDLNQFLTPYDILRLKNHLRISSADFLERYTMKHFGPESGLPIITFKSDRSLDLKCPFVTPSGCSVYENRPSSCRSYPLIRLASRSRETGKISEQYMLFEEPHCQGFAQDKTQTVRKWIESQGLAPYNLMNDILMELISLKNQFMPGQMDESASHVFYMACYDLDTFREHLFEKGILDQMKLRDEILESVKTDDEALLRLGIAWVKRSVFKVEDL